MWSGFKLSIILAVELIIRYRHVNHSNTGDLEMASQLVLFKKFPKVINGRAMKLKVMKDSDLYECHYVSAQAGQPPPSKVPVMISSLLPHMSSSFGHVQPSNEQHEAIVTTFFDATFNLSVPQKETKKAFFWEVRKPYQH